MGKFKSIFKKLPHVPCLSLSIAIIVSNLQPLLGNGCVSISQKYSSKNTQTNSIITYNAMRFYKAVVIFIDLAFKDMDVVI